MYTILQEAKSRNAPRCGIGTALAVCGAAARIPGTRAGCSTRRRRHAPDPSPCRARRQPTTSLVHTLVHQPTGTAACCTVLGSASVLDTAVASHQLAVPTMCSTAATCIVDTDQVTDLARPCRGTVPTPACALAAPAPADPAGARTSDYRSHMPRGGPAASPSQPLCECSTHVAHTDAVGGNDAGAGDGVRVRIGAAQSGVRRAMRDREAAALLGRLVAVRDALVGVVPRLVDTFPIEELRDARNESDPSAWTLTVAEIGAGGAAGDTRRSGAANHYDGCTQAQSSAWVVQGGYLVAKRNKTRRVLVRLRHKDGSLFEEHMVGVGSTQGAAPPTSHLSRG